MRGEVYSFNLLEKLAPERSDGPGHMVSADLGSSIGQACEPMAMYFHS